MKKLSLAFACVLCILLTASTSGMPPERISTFSGWTLEGIDTDGDLVRGRHFHSAGRGPLGSFTSGGFSELDVPDGVFCGTDKVSIPYKTSSSVVRYDRDGSLLFSKLMSGAVCVDPLDNFSFTFVIEREITGGTGRFAGATGTLSIEGAGARAGDDSEAIGYEGTSTGTVIVP